MAHLYWILLYFITGLIKQFYSFFIVGPLPFDQANALVQKQARELQSLKTEKLLHVYKKMCENREVDSELKTMECAPTFIPALSFTDIHSFVSVEIMCSLHRK